MGRKRESEETWRGEAADEKGAHQMHHNNRSATVRYHSSRDAQTAAADTDTPSVCGSQPEISLVQGADESRENEKFKRRTKVVPA